MPQELAQEAVKCKTDAEAAALGTEWAINQCRELYQAGINDIHFYTISSFGTMVDIIKAIL